MDNRPLQSPNLISPSKKISEIEKHNGNERSAGILIYVLIGIIICLVIIIAALALSSSQPPTLNKIPGVEIKGKQQEVIVITDFEKKDISQNKKINGKVEIDWMLKKIDAEQNSMPIWSKENYDKALVFEAKAIRYNNNEEYAKSKEKYNNAIKIIEETLLNKEKIYEQHLHNAITFLNEDKLDKAKKYFKKAAAIDPENNLIQRGLERIDNRGEVLKLYNLAVEEEDKENLNNSIQYLNKALIVEPEYIKLQKKFNFITEKKEKIDFNIAISKILTAIEIGHMSMAQTHLSLAKKINPNDPIIIELETKINDKNKIIKIINYKKRAINKEKKEQWKGAIKLYDSILKIDSNTSFAIVGKQRSKYYRHINQLLDDLILKPQRLQNNQVFLKSKKSLNYVKFEINKKTSLQKSKIPRLRKKTALAEKIIKNYSTMIDITMRSDNETSIVIYQVAKYGTFNEKSIQLRPGKYTIVGSKEGYRDYRNIINVTANDSVKLINVMCKEKI